MKKKNSSIKTKSFGRKIFSRFSDALRDRAEKRKLVKDNIKHLEISIFINHKDWYKKIKDIWCDY